MGKDGKAERVTLTQAQLTIEDHLETNGATKTGVITIGVGWHTEHTVDLDVSCVGITRDGNVDMKNTLYFGTVPGSIPAITATGDNKGKSLKDQELISVDLDKLPHHILAVFFVVNVVTPGKTFGDIDRYYFRFLDEHGEESARQNPIEELDDATAAVFCRIARANHRLTPHHLNEVLNAKAMMATGSLPDVRSWTFKPTFLSDKHARDFGSVVPDIKEAMRDMLPDIQVTAHDRVALLRKRAQACLSDYWGESVPGFLSFGIEWDCEASETDLDLSVVMLDAANEIVDVVYYYQPESKDGSVVHCHGDNRDGSRDGDDEVLDLMLTRVDPDVTTLTIVVNSYSGHELDDVVKCACHLFNPATGQDLVAFSLTGTDHYDKRSSCIALTLYRKNGDQNWNLQIIDTPTSGQTVFDCMDAVKQTVLDAQPFVYPEPRSYKNMDDYQPPLTVDLIKSGLSKLRSTRQGYGYTKLDLKGRGVCSLQGDLGVFTQLRLLDLSDNSVNNLDPLQHLNELCAVDVRMNRVQSLGKTGHLPNLQVLNLDDNEVDGLQSFDHDRLEALSLQRNRIKDFFGLQKTHYPRLRSLDVRSNLV